ncbi:MAG: DUF1631 family protein [Ottowia sp.]|nr:MAG: DUF1631 family protein [Ottowia sp.]
MVSTPQPPVPPQRLAHQLRERFVHALDAFVVELGERIQLQLQTGGQGGSRGGSVTDMQRAMDTEAAFRRERQAWVAAARRHWREAWTQMTDARGVPGGSLPADLGLVDDEIVERKIAASRLGAAVQDASGAEFNDLRLRVQSLERSSDLPARDVLRPDTFGQQLLKAWADRGLTRPMWALVHPLVQAAMVERMVPLYRQANAFLVERGVMAEINLKALVRRGEGDAGGRAGAGGAHGGADFAAASGGRPVGAGGGSMPTAPGGWQGRDHGGGPARLADGHGARPTIPGAAPSTTSTAYGGGHTQMPDVRHSALARAGQETRMMTAVSPMTRVRQRAQGVLGQLRRLLTDQLSNFDVAAPPGPPSPALARAIAEATPFAVTELMDSRQGDATIAQPMANVEVVATRLRQRATELKAKAEKPSEKAIIEIVALMFQAILAEERIAAAIRVWFARLQIPVLRLALAEPDFFASAQHPARQLIDRMGACALGFDASRVSGSRLEREIKRIVQVIEQYPETGRRVFQLVFEEFKKFLGRALTEGGAAQQMASLAQQIEQKDALTVQYTIELRRMLEPVPVPEPVREFLFRVWSEVLAMAAVRRGPQAADTLRYKQAAADLLWVVSPKSDRAERTRVVQQLPSLLHTLREGMEGLALGTADQDAHIKSINDAVVQAFVSRGEGLSPERLAELSRSLAGLEDVVTDDPQGDVLLDPGVIELMFGAEGDALEVIASGGSQPGDGMLHWAQELELGAWFSLDYQGSVSQVQYVWRSQRGQLHLFGDGAGKSYLVQTRRLASYLQAGLLVPVEDETLTVRATREALARLNAEPDRLLQ